MVWRGTARRHGAATMKVSSSTVATAAVAVAAIAATAGISLLQSPAQAQSSDYERSLAGIRLNAKSSAILRAFGNPNEVVVGDVGMRIGPLTAGQGGAAGAPGAPGMGPAGPSMGLGGGVGAASSMTRGGFPGAPGGPPPMMGGPGAFGGAGLGGDPEGMGGGDERGGSFGGFPGAPGGFPGAPGGGGLGGGATVGAFGQTTSTLARQQEVTWIYNTKAGKNLVSYEFLIGPDGNVIQIRALGYSGGKARTRRGVGLGATYKQVVQVYGYPEEHQKVGNILVASYRSRHHLQFQFLNQRGQTNPFDSGNKVIAMTVATVE